MINKQLAVVVILAIILTLPSEIIAEEIIVYNSTNFTKPANLTAPVNITGSNETKSLPQAKDTDEVTTTGQPYLMYQLPSDFKLPGTNISVNFSNSTNQTVATNNTTKISFMQRLDKNPWLKYGFIFFAALIVVIVAYVIYLNYGESGGGTIVFDRDFAPMGQM